MCPRTRVSQRRWRCCAVFLGGPPGACVFHVRFSKKDLKITLTGTIYQVSGWAETSWWSLSGGFIFASTPLFSLLFNAAFNVRPPAGVGVSAYESTQRSSSNTLWAWEHVRESGLSFSSTERWFCKVCRECTLCTKNPRVNRIIHQTRWIRAESCSSACCILRDSLPILLPHFSCLKKKMFSPRPLKCFCGHVVNSLEVVAQPRQLYGLMKSDLFFLLSRTLSPLIACLIPSEFVWPSSSSPPPSAPPLVTLLVQFCDLRPVCSWSLGNLWAMWK